MIAYAASQALRLVSNLVLTRLLFPEAFGTMALLQTILIGVTLLTDLGFSMSIIRSERGNTQDFLNTVWTLQIIKGILLAVLIFIFSNPLSQFYENPNLSQFINFMGIIAILNGLKSTKIDLAQRNLDVRSVLAIELSSQILQFFVTVLLAMHYKSIWTLLIGYATQSAILSLSTHLFLKGPQQRLMLNADIISEVFRFGGWVMISSTLIFLTGEGQNLLRAKFMSLDFLGQTSIAISLALLGWTAIQKLASSVIFPAYSHIIRSAPQDLHRRVRESRRLQLTFGWISVWCFIIFGPTLISILYDERYSDSGYILQAVAASLIVYFLSSTYLGLPEALGRPEISAFVIFSQGSLTAGGAIIGGIFFGPWGVIASGLISGLALYPITLTIYSKLGFKDPIFDIIGLALFMFSILYLFLAKNPAIGVMT